MKKISKKNGRNKRDLQGEDGLMFSGEPMSEEAVESLLDAMEYIVKQTKVINKNTFLRNIVLPTITDASLGGKTLKFVIRDLVQQLCTKHNTNNPYELADCLKINVLTWDLHEEINGFYKYEKEIVSSLLIIICLHPCKELFARMN